MPAVIAEVVEFDVRGGAGVLDGLASFADSEHGSDLQREQPSHNRVKCTTYGTLVKGSTESVGDGPEVGSGGLVGVDQGRLRWLWGVGWPPGRLERDWARRPGQGRVDGMGNAGKRFVSLWEGGGWGLLVGGLSRRHGGRRTLPAK